MQTKRMTFSSKWLPYALLAPQVIVTLIFFIWPAAQALYQSLLRQDIFGLSTDFVGLDNFYRLFADPLYLNSLNVTFWFAVGTTLLSMSVSLLFAVMVNRMIRSRDSYTTFSGLALCGRPCDCGRAVVVHLQSIHRDHAVYAGRFGV